jgi:Spy/CpxP family protein refolding chaperone
VLSAATILAVGGVAAWMSESSAMAEGTAAAPPVKAAAVPVKAPTASAASVTTSTTRPPVSEEKRVIGLFYEMSDPEIRGQIGLSAEQEAKIKAAQKKADDIRMKAEDEVIKKLVPDPTAPTTADREQAIQKAMLEARLATQPQLMPIMKDAVDLLTPDQAKKLQAVFDKRLRLISANGPLYVLGTRRAQQRLMLTDDIAGKIRKILDDNADKADALRKGVADAVKDIPIELRYEAEKIRWREVRVTIDANAVKARTEIFTLLTGDQKLKAEMMLADEAASTRPVSGFPTATPSKATPTTKATST